jgi:hypothetical protein
MFRAPQDARPLGSQLPYLVKQGFQASSAKYKTLFMIVDSKDSSVGCTARHSATSDQVIGTLHEYAIPTARPLVVVGLRDAKLRFNVL